MTPILITNIIPQWLPFPPFPSPSVIRIIITNTINNIITIVFSFLFLRISRNSYSLNTHGNNSNTSWALIMFQDASRCSPPHIHMFMKQRHHYLLHTEERTETQIQINLLAWQNNKTLEAFYAHSLHNTTEPLRFFLSIGIINIRYEDRVDPTSNHED